MIQYYANDTLLILEACPTQLIALQNLLSSFSQSTRLRVNYNKFVLVPLNISKDNLNNYQTFLIVRKEAFPSLT